MHPCLPTAPGWRTQAHTPVREIIIFFAATNFSILAAIEMTVYSVTNVPLGKMDNLRRNRGPISCLHLTRMFLGNGQRLFARNSPEWQPRTVVSPDARYTTHRTLLQAGDAKLPADR